MEVRERIAFYTGDAESCFKVLKRLRESGENIFARTKERLMRGDSEYPYVIFDQDQWVGNMTPGLLEIRADGTDFNKQLDIIEL